MFLLVRIVLCFAPSYWVIVHAVCFFFLLVMLVTTVIAHRIPLKPQSKEKEIARIFELYPALKQEVGGQNVEFGYGVDHFAADAREQEVKKEGFIRKYALELLTGALTIVFLIYILCYQYAEPDDIEFENSHKQIEFSGFALIMVVAYAFYALWIRLFQKDKYIVSGRLLLLALVGSITIIVLGVIFYAAMSTKVELVLISFILGPLYLFALLIFMGYWITNDFCIYEKEGREDKKQVSNQDRAQVMYSISDLEGQRNDKQEERQHLEENKGERKENDEGTEGGARAYGSENQRASMKDSMQSRAARLQAIAHRRTALHDDEVKTPLCTDCTKFWTCKACPQTKKDWLTACKLISSFIIRYTWIHYCCFDRVWSQCLSIIQSCMAWLHNSIGDRNSAVLCNRNSEVLHDILSGIVYDLSYCVDQQFGHCCWSHCHWMLCCMDHFLPNLNISNYR